MKHDGTDLALPAAVGSGDPSAKKRSVTERLRAYWALREARGQEASIPPPLETDPPTPPVSGLAPSADTAGGQTSAPPTIPPSAEDDDGIAFAEFRLRLLRRRR
ncbi:MAG TPA: hypothetical protein VHO25_04400 [Polyangiaceae bacterium]|nr:hypothetical protein [Polyangiaceae bacterium]